MYKLLSSILSDFGFEFEEDQKIEARKMEKMLDLIRSYTMKVTENHQSLWELTFEETFRSNEPMHVTKWNNLLDDEIARVSLKLLQKINAETPSSSSGVTERKRSNSVPSEHQPRSNTAGERKKQKSKKLEVEDIETALCAMDSSEVLALLERYLKLKGEESSGIADALSQNEYFSDLLAKDIGQREMQNLVIEVERRFSHLTTKTNPYLL
jgi:hypothetical protein